MNLHKILNEDRNTGVTGATSSSSETSIAKKRKLGVPVKDGYHPKGTRLVTKREGSATVGEYLRGGRSGDQIDAIQHQRRPGGLGRWADAVPDTHKSLRGFRKIKGESAKDTNWRRFKHVNSSTEYSGPSLHEMLVNEVKGENRGLSRDITKPMGKRIALNIARRREYTGNDHWGRERATKDYSGDIADAKRATKHGIETLAKGIYASTEYSYPNLVSLLETTRDEQGNKIGKQETRDALAAAIRARRKSNLEKGKTETAADTVSKSTQHIMAGPAPEGETDDARKERLGRGSEGATARRKKGAAKLGKDPEKGLPRGRGVKASVGDAFAHHAGSWLAGESTQYGNLRNSLISEDEHTGRDLDSNAKPKEFSRRQMRLILAKQGNRPRRGINTDSKVHKAEATLIHLRRRLRKQEELPSEYPSQRVLNRKKKLGLESSQYPKLHKLLISEAADKRTKTEIDLTNAMKAGEREVENREAGGRKLGQSARRKAFKPFADAAVKAANDAGIVQAVPADKSNETRSDGRGTIRVKQGSGKSGNYNAPDNK